MPFAFLHGFASGPKSRKGTYLRQVFAEHGAELALPDLNQPDFAHLTFGASLEVIERLTASQTGWRIIGSSLGGYLAARFAELHPERVEKLVLLCPGFALVGRWPELLGEQSLAQWRSEGVFPFPDGAGIPTPVHYRFFEEAQQHPAWPEVRCPTLIIHGRQDVFVPIEHSRRYAASRPQVQLVELDDDHRLFSSKERIAELALEFFGLGQGDDGC